MSSAPADGTRIIERSDGAVWVVKRSTLVVERGEATPAELTLEASPIIVGSAVDCDLQLRDPAVSAQHIAIAPTPQGMLLRDLDSTNGTFLAGRRVERVYLAQQDRIELGDCTLRFDSFGDEIEIPISSRTNFGELLGHSESMKRVFAILERVSKTDATVLLEGESGTGKEVAARSLHDASTRRDGPFVAVDCGALPANLIESELFGHRRGAFTGADADRAGLFEEASGGTLFLDEVGELPLDLQPKLLRALETRTIRRVGETTARQIDVRLVAATNRRLQLEVQQGSFRQDLFFRLSVIALRLPALRERRQEIPRLVAHFCAQHGKDAHEVVTPSMQRLLSAYDWPGNVRELRNVVDRLLLVPGMDAQFYLPNEAAIAADHNATAETPPLVDLDLPYHEGKRRFTERFERHYLAGLLARCSGNVSEVARVSGLSRQSCHRLLKRYELAR
ncbi:MAG: sigma 54-interacting transcriptional regulator [Deltaproteobacteria bacterium]|nr:sigma 54-interacting transcriptional regulator [Deltaproteobacteria bacterium]